MESFTKSMTYLVTPTDYPLFVDVHSAAAILQGPTGVSALQGWLRPVSGVQNPH